MRCAKCSGVALPALAQAAARSWDSETEEKVRVARETIAVLNGMYGLNVELRPIGLDELGVYGLRAFDVGTTRYPATILFVPQRVPSVAEAERAVRHAFRHFEGVGHSAPLVSLRNEGSTTSEVTLEVLDSKMSIAFTRLEEILEEQTGLLREILDRFPRRRVRVPAGEVDPGSTTGLVLAHVARHSHLATDGRGPYDLSTTGIARAVGLTPPATAYHLALLEDQGLVVRRSRIIQGPSPSPHRRLITYTLSPGGRAWSTRHGILARCDVHPTGCPLGVEATP